MSEEKKFPPRVWIKEPEADYLRMVHYGPDCEFISLREHNALLAAKDAEIDEAEEVIQERTKLYASLYGKQVKLEKEYAALEKKLEEAADLFEEYAAHTIRCCIDTTKAECDCRMWEAQAKLRGDK